MAKTFKDSTGYEWHPNLTVGALCDASVETGLNISQLFGATLRFDQLRALLWFACAKEAERQAVPRAVFNARLTGQSLTTAVECFGELFADTMPTPENTGKEEATASGPFDRGNAAI